MLGKTRVEKKIKELENNSEDEAMRNECRIAVRAALEQ